MSYSGSYSRSPNYLSSDANPPIKDTISWVSFRPDNPNQVGVTSWDGTFRLFELQMNNTFSAFSQVFIDLNSLPLLCFCWVPGLPNEPSVVLGAIDGSVVMLYLGSNNKEVIFTHQFAVRNLYMMDNSLLSCDVERTMVCHGSNNDKFVHVFEKDTTALAVDKDYIFAATLDTEILYGDLSSFKNKTIKRFSEPRISGEILSIFADMDKGTLVVGTNESRVIYMLIKKIYNRMEISIDVTFRSHYDDQKTVNLGYQVNFVKSFVVQTQFSIMTGGGDGNFFIWVPALKNKVFEMKGNAPVTAFDIDVQNLRVCIGFSNDYSHGVFSFGNQRSPPQLMVVQLTPANLRL